MILQDNIKSYRTELVHPTGSMSMCRTNRGPAGVFVSYRIDIPTG